MTFPNVQRGAVRGSKGNDQKCTVFVNATERKVPSYLWLVCVYNPLIYGQDESMSVRVDPDFPVKKKKTRGICVFFRRSAGCWGQRAGSHTNEKAQLETDRGIGPNRSDDKEGGVASRSINNSTLPKHRKRIYFTAGRAETIVQRNVRW